MEKLLCKIKNNLFQLGVVLLISNSGLATCLDVSHPDLRFVNFVDVYDEALAKDAIIRNEQGFENDFLLLHCLIKEYQPSNLFEIGTCEGKGTMIVANAIGDGKVYSLELPPEDQRDFHLEAERIGMYCTLPYVQLFGDSMTFDYTQYFPLDSWFIDGFHDYGHVYYETLQALRSNPILIVWHDTDMDDVFQAVVDAFEDNHGYSIVRVLDTRITYAIKK